MGLLCHLIAKGSRAYRSGFRLIRQPDNSQGAAGLSLGGHCGVPGSQGHKRVGNDTGWLLWPQKECPVEGQAGHASNMAQKIRPNILADTCCSPGSQRTEP